MSFIKLFEHIRDTIDSEAYWVTEGASSPEAMFEFKVTWGVYALRFRARDLQYDIQYFAPFLPIPKTLTPEQRLKFVTYIASTAVKGFELKLTEPEPGHDPKWVTLIRAMPKVDEANNYDIMLFNRVFADAKDFLRAYPRFLENIATEMGVNTDILDADDEK